VSTRPRVCLVLSSLSLLAAAGSRQSVAAEPAPAVDIADLPPLPAAEEVDSTRSMVLAASEVDEDVVVGAAKREQSLGNVASAVTVITADRIRRFGYRTVGEAVAAVAGAYLVDNRLSYSIGIRGMQVPGDFNTRLLVLVDGATVNETWGAYAGLGFDAIVGIDEIARIEVIRGPVSSVYGTNAFFGIINIVTRGAAETSRVWGRAGVHSIQGAISSAGFAAGGVDRQLRGAVQVMSRFGEDGLVLPDGGMVHGGGADGSRSFTGGVVGVWGGTFAQLRAVHFNRESPFAPYDVSPNAAPYDQVDELLFAEGGHTRQLNDRITVAARGYTSAYEFRDLSPPADPADPAGGLRTSGTARIVGGELRGRTELVGPDRLGLTTGVEASSNRTRSTAFNEATPGDRIDEPRNFALVGGYAELDGQPTSWLGFTGGVRFDHHSELDDRVSPRAAVFLAKPERYGLKLLYAQGFRNPSAFEAYFQDGSDFIADPDALDPERIQSFEVVAWAKPRPGLSTRVSGFAWDARDIIESRPSPMDMDLLQFQNVTRYVSRGVEAELSYRDAQGWYAFAGGALALVGTEDDSGELVFGTVPNAPKLTAGAGVSTPRLLGKTHVSLEGLFIGPRPTRAGETGPSPEAPSWLGLNLTLFTPNVRGFDVTASVRNLLGRRDLIPTPGDYDRTMPSRTVARVPGEGREIYVKLGYSY
jgi:outer membrane receptor for ferrienterochelin and colicins